MQNQNKFLHEMDYVVHMFLSPCIQPVFRCSQCSALHVVIYIEVLGYHIAFGDIANSSCLLK